MENEICHGCGNKYDDCICEELDDERDEGKYPDDDPNDGDYNGQPYFGNKKQHWIIDVGGYGSFFFNGNESEAEEMRKHKANWEHGVGRKRLADENELKTGVINKCKNHPNFTNSSRYYCKCGEC